MIKIFAPFSIKEEPKSPSTGTFPIPQNKIENTIDRF